MTHRPSNERSTSVTENSTGEHIRLIDSLWQTERDRHSLIPWFGITALPSKMLSIGIGLACFVSWGYYFELALWNSWASFWPGVIGVAITGFFPLYIYKRAYGLEKAENAWLGSRAHAIAISGGPSPYPAGRETKRPGWHNVLLGVALFALAALVVDVIFLAQGIYWVGIRDLEITFVVVDAETDRPIEGAGIVIPENKTTSCVDCDGPFKLTTDGKGTAKRLCKDCMCFGYSGWKPLFRRLDTFGTHTPRWKFQVSAPGYLEGDWRPLKEQENRSSIERGEKYATMRVPVTLKKLP